MRVDGSCPLLRLRIALCNLPREKIFRNAVFGDMGNMNTERDAYWSAMYVLLSRATRMEDLLVFRCPPKSFFDQGPPAYLRAFLSELNASDGPVAKALAEGT